MATHQDKVGSIAELVGVPKPVFQTFYWEALVKYAAFVQAMPVSRELPDRVLLDEALVRVIRALNRRRGFLLPTGAEAETIAAETDIWTYAVFLASLLQGIGTLALDRSVKLFDAQHRSLGCWEPWAGAIEAPAKWYQVSFIPESRAELADRLSLMLAQHILPSAGLKWLWSNPAVLTCWMGTVSGDVPVAGILGEIIALPRKGAERFGPSLSPQLSMGPADTCTATLPTTAPSSAEPVDHDAANQIAPLNEDDLPSSRPEIELSAKSDDPGQAFLSWLRAGISQGTIAVDGTGAHIHRAPEGILLVSPGIFQEYDERNWQRVQRRFLKLKLHQKSVTGNNFVTYRVADNAVSAITGVLIPDAQLVFGELLVASVHSGLIAEGK